MSVVVMELDEPGAEPLALDALSEWIRDLVVQDLPEATRRTYHAQVKAALSSIASMVGIPEPELALTDLTTAALRDCLVAYAAAPDQRFRTAAKAPRDPAKPAPKASRSQASVRSRLQALRAFARWCVAQRYLAADPTRALKVPQPRPQSSPALSAEGARLVLAGALLGRSPARDHLLIALILTHGLSLKELSELRRADADETVGTISVRRRGQARTLTLSPLALEALKTYLPIRETRLTRSGERSTRLLLSSAKSPSASLGRAVERCFDRAGLPRAGATAHALRATFAALALDGGASPRMVMNTLGVQLPALRQLTHQAGDVEVGTLTHPLAEG